MDIAAISAYLSLMALRILAMLAILAITVVTTATSAHDARMSVGSSPEHAAHVGHKMHSPDIVDVACDAGQHCGSADAGMCEFVCAGISALLTSPDGEAEYTHGHASHDLPSEAIHVSRAPGLNERPPKLRLL